jgi:hypothetical protein
MEELEGMRNLLVDLGNVPAKDILGFRAPSLKLGFNHQFKALIDTNFLWDSSISTKVTYQPVWPYTMDYAIPHECKIDSCPTKSYPGLWQIPVNLHYAAGMGSGQCSYLDQCVFALLHGDDVFDWLKVDFKRHYNVSICSIFFSKSTTKLLFTTLIFLKIDERFNTNSTW